MSLYQPPFEIHVHGDLPVRDDVGLPEVQEALKPLWHYAGERSLKAASASKYEDEPGIVFDPKEKVVHLCWTVVGNEDFRQVMEEACMSLNEIVSEGATLEVSFYDVEFDDDEDEEADSRDDFMMCFVGPTPAAIMQVQRDLLVQDVVGLMERHFDGSELGEVVTAIDRLFEQRIDDLIHSMQLGEPPRGMGGGSHGGRKSRHLH